MSNKDNGLGGSSLQGDFRAVRELRTLLLLSSAPVMDAVVHPQWEEREDVAQELDSCTRKLRFHQLVTTLWAFLVIILETRDLAEPHSKGVMVCGCSGT